MQRKRLTTKQAAEHLGVTPRRVRQYIAGGRLRATRQGRDWMIDERTLYRVVNLPDGRPPGKRRTKKGL